MDPNTNPVLGFRAFQSVCMGIYIYIYTRLSIYLSIYTDDQLSIQGGALIS